MEWQEFKGLLIWEQDVFIEETCCTVNHLMKLILMVINLITICFFFFFIASFVFILFIWNRFAEKYYDDDELYKTFGISKDFVTSAARVLRSVEDYPNCLADSIKATHEVATADYEHNSRWGSKVCFQIMLLVLVFMSFDS